MYGIEHWFYSSSQAAETWVKNDSDSLHLTESKALKEKQSGRFSLKVAFEDQIRATGLHEELHSSSTSQLTNNIKILRSSLSTPPCWRAEVQKHHAAVSRLQKPRGVTTATIGSACR